MFLPLTDGAVFFVVHPGTYLNAILIPAAVHDGTRWKITGVIAVNHAVVEVLDNSP